MTEAGETEYDRPSLSYRVGLIAGVPGAVAFIPLCLAALGAMGAPLDGMGGTQYQPVAGLVYLALLLWSFVGPLCLIVVTVASIKMSRGADDPRRARQLRMLAWATLASWGLLIMPMAWTFLRL